MRNNDPLLDKDKVESSIIHWSIVLLIVGGGIDILTYIVASFWEVLGLSSNGTIWLALLMMIAFGLNLAGLIVGFFEIRKSRNKAIIGIVGNLLFILFFFFVVGYSLFGLE